MPHVDARGLPVSGGTPETLAAYESSLARLVGGERLALAPIDAALGHAPGFAMGHALRAGACIIDDDRTSVRALSQAVMSIAQAGNVVDR